MKSLVIFHGSSDHPLARWLKPGFAHCLVCILVERDGQGWWLSIDPAVGVPIVNVECGPDGDLRGYYEALGCVVVETETSIAHPPRWSWALANCVGVVKYVLGIRAPFVITPFQLYKRLTHGKSTGHGS